MKDAEGRVLGRLETKTSPQGIASGSFELSAQVPEGDYLLSASLGTEVTEHRVRVGGASRATPGFQVELTIDPVLQSQEAAKPPELHGHVRAHYTLGAPVAGGEVQIIARCLQEIPSGSKYKRLSGVLNSRGTFSFSVPFPRETERWVVEASVLAPSGESQRASIDAIPIIEIDAVLESKRLLPELANTLLIQTRARRSGSPVPAQLLIEPGGLKVKSNARGFARITLPPSSTREFHISARSPEGWSARRTFQFDWANSPLRLETDRTLYGAGDVAKVRAVGPLPDHYAIEVHLVGALGSPFRAAKSHFHNGVADTEFQIPEGVRGRVDFALDELGEYRTFRTVVIAVPELTLKLLPDRPQYRPGEVATVSVETALGQHATPAALGLFATLSSQGNARIDAPLAHFGGADWIALGGLDRFLERPPASYPTEWERASLLSITNPALEDERAFLLAKITREASVAQRVRFNCSLVRSLIEEQEGVVLQMWLVSPFGACSVLMLAILGGCLFHGHRSTRLERFGAAAGTRWNRAMLRLAVSWLLAMLGSLLLCAMFLEQRLKLDLPIADLNILFLPLLPLLHLASLVSAVIVLRTARTQQLPFQRRLVGALALMPAAICGSVLLLNRFGDFPTVSSALESWTDINPVWTVKAVLVLMVLLVQSVFAALSLLNDFPVARSGRGARRFGLGVRLFYGGLPLTLVSLVSLLRCSARPPLLSAEILVPPANESTESSVSVNTLEEAGQSDRSAGFAVVDPGILGEEASRRGNDTALWGPELVTSAKGKATFQIPITGPSPIVKVTAMGTDASNHWGQATVNLLVAAAISVDAIVPVTLDLGQKAVIPISVFNYLSTAQEVRVGVETSPGLRPKVGSLEHVIWIGPRATVHTPIEVVASSVGEQWIRATAIGVSESDSRQRRLSVTPGTTIKPSSPLEFDLHCPSQVRAPDCTTECRLQLLWTKADPLTDLWVILNVSPVLGPDLTELDALVASKAIRFYSIAEGRVTLFMDGISADSRLSIPLTFRRPTGLDIPAIPLEAPSATVSSRVLPESVSVRLPSIRCLD